MIELPQKQRGFTQHQRVIGAQGTTGDQMGT